jgi:hypothetical protein
MKNSWLLVFFGILNGTFVKAQADIERCSFRFSFKMIVVNVNARRIGIR